MVSARALFCALAAGVATAAPAAEIFKCVDASGTGYQGVPCPAGARESALRQATLPAPSWRQDPLRSARKPGPWRHRTLTLGMTDDEVLNLPGWGRPSRINRVRMPRAWREEWIYDQGMLVEQRLYFVNAKLVEVVAVQPEARVVGAAAFATAD